MREAFPLYTVTARNTSVESENKIHDDTVARQYGFRGGLVPGVTVYAYLTYPVAAAFGAGWLDRGTASVRFLKPIFDGEPVEVAGEITSRAPQGITVTVHAKTAANGECAVLAAGLPAGLPTPVNPALYRRAPVPAERPHASRELFAAVDTLGTPITPYDERQAREYLQGIADGLPLYRGDGARVHPAFYLHQANRALSYNVRLGPWIHVSSTVRHLGAARVGDTLETQGKVRSLYDKKGREYVELDLLMLAGERRPVAHIQHTAIYRLPAPGA